MQPVQPTKQRRSRRDRPSLRNIVLKDLKANKRQFSWDWEADLRFAEACGYEEETSLLRSFLQDNGTYKLWPLLFSLHRKFIQRKITQPRLKALRQLVKEGLVKAYWVGSGELGRCDFQVARFRAYELTQQTN